MSTEESIILKSAGAGVAFGSAAGRAVGGVRGVVVGAVLGGVVGGAFGLLKKLFTAEGAAQLALQGQERVRFVDLSFALMGALAKADGRVSEREVAVAERVMLDWGLDSAERAQAVAAFSSGRQASFSIEVTALELKSLLAREPSLKPRFLQALFPIATADGMPRREHAFVLQRIAQTLGLQVDFGGQVPPPRTAIDGLDPFKVLGVAANASDDEVRQAYRRKMSKYHPDKLQGHGVAGDTLKVAEERVRQVRAAYDEIEKRRGRH